MSGQKIPAVFAGTEPQTETDSDLEKVLLERPASLLWVYSEDPSVAFAPPSRYRTVRAVTTYGAYEEPI